MGEQNFNENELVVVPCFDRGWPAIGRELKGVRGWGLGLGTFVQLEK